MICFSRVVSFNYGYNQRPKSLPCLTCTAIVGSVNSLRVASMQPHLN